MADITPDELNDLERAFRPLIGLKISWLSIPGVTLVGFEPSQIAVIVNTLLDASMQKFATGRRLIEQDFEKDTNFGKLKRIPYAPLQEFMRKHGAI